MCLQDNSGSLSSGASISNAFHHQPKMIDLMIGGIERVRNFLVRCEEGFNSLPILGAWVLCKHRNMCVFKGMSPSMARALLLAKEEVHFWMLAGARGMSFLAALDQAG